jgi:hypothetical protein
MRTGTKERRGEGRGRLEDAMAWFAVVNLKSKSKYVLEN